jgi:hypothetical protein
MYIAKGFQKSFSKIVSWRLFNQITITYFLALFDTHQFSLCFVLFSSRTLLINQLSVVGTSEFCVVCTSEFVSHDPNKSL